MSDLPPQTTEEKPLVAETEERTAEASPKKRRVSKLITHPVRLLAEAVFAVVFLVALAVGGLMWRLSYGPISLQSSLPTVQSVLSDITPGLKFTIDKAMLEPGNRWRAFNARLTGVTVRNQDNQPIGSLEEMVLGFSWRNFLNVTFIPSIIEIRRPTIQVTRFEDGHIGFNLQVKDPENKPKAQLPEFAHLMANTLWALREVRITGAFIRYEDQKDPFSFDAKDGIFVLKRDRNVVSGTLALDIKSDKLDQKIRGTIQYDPTKDLTHFSVGLRDLPPDQLADFLPQIPSDIQLKMPSNILLTLTVDKTFMPIAVDMQVTGVKGTLVYPPYYPEAIELSNVLLNARYDLLKGSFEVSELYAQLEEAHLRAQASMKRGADETQPSQIEVLGLLENFPVNGLKSYWPQGLAMHARTWIVDHLHEGIVERAGLDMKATLDKDKKFAIRSLGGKIKFHGMTVNYLPPMQPVENVAAEARYDLNNFDIAVEKGELLNTKVERAAINITDFDKHEQVITLDIDTKGPAEDVIKVISAKPLEYPQKLGFNAGQFSGNSATNIHLRFPLLNDLKLNQVEMKTMAELTDLTVRNAVKDLTVSGKNMKINVDTDKLHLWGDAVLADGNAKVTWDEFFGDEAPYTTVINIDGDVTPAALKGLRLPTDKYFSGTAAVKADVKQDKKKTTFVTVEADLNKAGIALPELRIEKKQGAAGRLKFDVTALREGATTISKLSGSWPDFAVNDGTVRWNADDELDTATLKGMTVGRSKVDIDIAPTGPNAVKAVLKGDILDLSGYWTKPKDPAEKESEAKDTRRYDVVLDAGTLYLDSEIPFKNVRAVMSVQGGGLITGNIAADTDQNGFLRIKQVALASGARQLDMRTENAGRVFQALDITDKVAGGSLQVSGASTKEAPTVINGRAELKNFTISKAPVLARIINAFSPGGIIELLNSSGLAFSEMSTDFILERPQVIRFKNGRMTGASIGMSFKGRVYRDTQTVNISGTIVPIEGLNKMVGKIPLIGQILTGLKGEGLIAATYKVKGKTEDPGVTVNPLSVLTPGILRSIFFEDQDD